MTLQFRKGVDSDRLTITPAVGEPIYTTDTKQLYIGDGSTAGGVVVSGGGGGGIDSASTQAIIDSNIGAIGADLLPALDSTYDLGSASKKWKDLHLSGNSIFLGGHKIVKDGDTIKFTDSAGATINVTAGNVATTLIDSSDVTAIITAGGYTTYDSTNASGQITTAINNLIDAAPASLDTLNELAAALNDDANFATTVTASIAALPDSAQVATIVTSYGYTTYDSSNTTGLIDSAYINARVSATDSATVSAIITADVDAAFINALTIDADTLGGQNSAYHLDYNNFTNTPTLYDSGNFTGQLAAASTSDLSEGTNLYYTTARHDSDFDARLSGGTGVTISSGQVSIAQSVGTTDSVEFGNIDVSGNVIVGGNLQVTGTTTTVNSENLNVTDNMIYLNAGESAGSPTAAIDVGWAANINDDGSYTHVGMFRDATDNTFKVFGNYAPEPDASVEINTGHASFTLAPFAASTLTGQYQGFDSDVTAAGLATQTYVNNAVASLPDSAQVATIVTSYGYTTYDSTNTLGLIDSAYIQARQVDLQRDSAFVTGIIDSAYIQARQTAGGGGTTQQTFKTIAIAGQSDVVADDSADTLTLVAGTGITLTTDAGTDTITITASGGGGGGLDSAATNTLIDAKLQVLDVSDVVGADGNAGQLLKSLGNGEAEWTDLKIPDFKPSSSTASGNKGEITYDSDHLYICVATNSWRRIIWTDSSW